MPPCILWSLSLFSSLSYPPFFLPMIPPLSPPPLLYSSFRRTSETLSQASLKAGAAISNVGSAFTRKLEDVRWDWEETSEGGDINSATLKVVSFLLKLQVHEKEKYSLFMCSVIYFLGIFQKEILSAMSLTLHDIISHIRAQGVANLCQK